MEKELYKFFKEYKRYCNKYDYEITFFGFLKWYEEYIMHIED